MVVRVDAGKDGVEAEINILLVYDVLSRHLILVALAFSEVYHEDERRVRAQTHHEVVWLYVPIYVPVIMQHL